MGGSEDPSAPQEEELELSLEEELLEVSSVIYQGPGKKIPEKDWEHLHLIFFLIHFVFVQCMMGRDKNVLGFA